MEEFNSIFFSVIKLFLSESSTFFLSITARVIHSPHLFTVFFNYSLKLRAHGTDVIHRQAHVYNQLSAAEFLFVVYLRISVTKLEVVTQLLDASEE
jgi:hypothetical protein